MGVTGDDLIDATITALQSNADLVAFLANADPANIYPYYDGEPAPDQTSTNFEQAVQEQKMGTIMVSYQGFTLGTREKFDITVHNMVCHLKAMGRIQPMFGAFRYGVLATTGMPLRLSTIHPKMTPPDNFTGGRAPMYIGGGYMVYDMQQVTFTLTEKGLDTQYP